MKPTFDIEPFAGFDPEIALLLGTMADGTREWRENLGEPPQEAVIWQPYPGAPSIGAVILHMADCVAYWFETYCTGKHRPENETVLLLARETDQDNGRWPKPHDRPLVWYLETHDDIVQRSVEAIRNIPAATRFEHPNETMTMRWVAAHVAEHDSYHGGQCVMLYELWKRTQN